MKKLILALLLTLTGCAEVSKQECELRKQHADRWVREMGATGKPQCGACYGFRTACDVKVGGYVLTIHCDKHSCRVHHECGE